MLDSVSCCTASLRTTALFFTIALVVSSVVGCGRTPASPPAVSLVGTFGDATVSGSPSVEREFPRLELRLDDESTIEAPEEAGPLRGWSAFHQVEDLEVRDGRLVGRLAGDMALLTVELPDEALPEDLLYELRVELATDRPATLGVNFFDDEELDAAEILEYIDDGPYSDLMKEIEVADEPAVLSFTEADSPFNLPVGLAGTRHLMLRLDGAEGAQFELESIRLIPRTEHLAGVSSGVGWHGLARGIFRETVVSRTPETVSWELSLGQRPWLDLAIGTPEVHPVTFRLEVSAGDGDPVVVERTVTVDDRWEPLTVDLERFAGRDVRLSLSLAAEEEARIGFWGSPAIRHRGAVTTASSPTELRARLARAEPPQGVVVIVTDTLRKDHLDAWGYERETAPILARLAADGVRFQNNVSQGTWTKVSVPAILTSLYATTHGIYDVPHRVPASVTTLGESLRDAGYATFHTSSVIFSGRNSNLHQGIEVLHERSSLTDLGNFRSKTGQPFVDRLLPWLEDHREQPFFVFLHVFDPHSPFRPRPPWDRRWLDEEELAEHEENVEQVEEVVEIFHELPNLDELAEAGVKNEPYTRAQIAWYDASIRAMDHEIGRVLERLEELGLRDDTLIAVVSDHGEEFREHGEPWHGHSVYGEMINVPMIVNWPGVVPAGVVVEQMTQSIDLMPTLLELARVPVPEQAQGRSLLPFMVAPDDPVSVGWAGGPVFSERRMAPGEEDEGMPDAYTVIDDGWKLIWNVEVRDERPEYELFDYAADPLDGVNLAAEHPERVSELRGLIEEWRERAEAAKLSDEALSEELSPEELEELRALGYID